MLIFRSTETLPRMPNTTPLIEGLLDQGEITMVYGAGGSGKSLFSLNMCKSLLSGEDSFLGLPVCSKPETILYVDGESSMQTLSLRLPKLGHSNMYLGIDERNVMGSFDDLVSFFSEKLMPRSVIVLDNLTVLTRLDQSSQIDIDAFSEFVIKLRDSGLSVLLLHHSNKAGGYFGSSVLERFPTIIAQLHLNKERERCSLTLKKDRDGRATWETISYALNPDTLRTELVLDLPVARNEAMTITKQVLSLLADNQQGMLKSQIIACLSHVDKNTLYVTLGRLIKRGHVTKEEDGMIFLNDT